MRTDRVVLKGTKDGLLVIIPRNQDIELVKRDLEERLSRPDRFFVGARAVLDLGSRWTSNEVLAQLLEIIERRGLKLIKVVGPFGVRMRDGVDAAFADPSPVTTGKGIDGNQESRLEPADAGDATMLVRRTIRSGQQVHHTGNLVILGDVNPGAEVLASGDIVVVGTLRGLAHAGMAGNERSVVVAFRLAPTQLRIANVIARAPDGRDRGPNTPEIARIRDGTIVIESYYPPAGR